MFEERENEVLSRPNENSIYLKKDDACVCINIHIKNEKKYDPKKEERTDYKCKKKEEKCVCINIYVECED